MIMMLFIAFLLFYVLHSLNFIPSQMYMTVSKGGRCIFEFVLSSNSSSCKKLAFFYLKKFVCLFFQMNVRNFFKFLFF